MKLLVFSYLHPHINNLVLFSYAGIKIVTIWTSPLPLCDYHIRVSKNAAADALSRLSIINSFEETFSDEDSRFFKLSIENGRIV